MSRSSRIPRPLLLALSGLLAATSVALAPVAAQAAIKAPTGLSPSGTVSTGTPTFTWNRVSGATQYQLVVDNSSSFSSPLISTSTANNKYVPTGNLPDGAIYWEVRAQGNAGTSAWATSTATISPTGAPSPISPIGGVTLSQPGSPPLFTWSPVTGAAGYEVQVDNTGTWNSPATYAVTGTSYFVDTPQASGTWFWRVRANRGNGLYTGWSSTATYVVGQLADVQPGADMSSGTPVQDVAIDWQAVPGAMLYQLQVGRDPDFNNIVDDRIVFGTTYQPPSTYDNDQYYWRVRAIDAGNNRMPWTQASPFAFQRNWPQQPTLQWPPNQLAPSVGDPLFFQWTPVRHATNYQLDISGDPNFSPGQYFTCTTSGTTYPIGNPPGSDNSCGGISAGQTFYWRVRGIDLPTGVNGIYSAIHSFTYEPDVVNQTAPANNATVDVPTLKWDPVRGANSYHVILKDKNGGGVADFVTSSRSWTPEVRLTAANSPYAWTVQSIDGAGTQSPRYPAEHFSVTGNDPTGFVQPALTPLTGLTSDPATSDFPSLSWVPLPGTVSYQVFIGVHGSPYYDDTNTSHINGAIYHYPAATDTGTHYLTPGSYDWFVEATDSVGGTTDGPVATFHVRDLAAATGQRIALDGLATQNGTDCANSLDAPLASQQICIGVPATPVLAWDPVPGAAAYVVYLAADQELTNLVVPPSTTTNTTWRPPSDLPDNTAQDAYYWYVRPCKSTGPLLCNPDPVSTHAAATNAFRKLSPALQLLSPADSAAVTNEPTFSWKDYLDTNQAVTYAGGANASPQTARDYRIQISQSPTFNALVDDREVDQPFYTPNDRTLPQGTLYWRVQAVDPAVNHLTWSEVRSFSNNQPTISLTSSGGGVPSPVGGVTVGGSTPFRWAPQNGAAGYTIEVYKGDDVTHSPANLVFQGTTRVPAYVWPNFLPPSSSAYRWRVRWTDAYGQLRPWSADGRFFVSASTVTLTAPASGTYQQGNNLDFTWGAVPFAATYRLDVRDASGNPVASWTTAATSFAPSTVNDGSYLWRVTALDPSNGAIAASTWRPFQVDGTAPTLTAYSPNPTGTPKSRVKVKFSEAVTGVTATSIQLHVRGRTSRLPATVKLAANHLSATLVPKAALKHGKTYTVRVTSAIRDGAGNHLRTFTWRFTV